MPRPFLTARWMNLVLANYAVPDDLLLHRLPAGCELDRFDGSAYVSLVAFDFLDTRVAGVRWPGFVNFPEINLRFYVRMGDRRGVCFIREFVPSRLISSIARSFYNEPYSAVPMTSQSKRESGRVDVTHRVRACNRDYSIHATANDSTHRPADDSREHWFKEHQWGFGASRRGVPLIYEVRHPHWDVYESPRVELHWDFSAIYGPEWNILNARSPDSVVFAVGSEVAVFPKGAVRDA